MGKGTPIINKKQKIRKRGVIEDFEGSVDKGLKKI